jgi:prevent-host-death family protein
MQSVQARPVRDLRNKYSEIESLLEDHDSVIITKNGRGSAVLLNLEDYSKLEEYRHYMFVAEKLREAEEEENSPDAEWSDYKEVFRNLREKYNGL